MSSVVAHPDQTAVDHGPPRASGERDRAGAGVDQYRITALEHRVQNLSVALHSRDVIGQANGILIAHYAVGADDAFALLVRVSQNTNTKLAEIAAALVARVRERGPAHPQQCQVVTEVLDHLLAGGVAREAAAPSPDLRPRRATPDPRA